jgi:hypothetical protein
VEEIGLRFGLDQYEAREAFAALRGDVWEGEFIEANEEPGWEGMVLKGVPSSGSRETRRDAHLVAPK